MSDESRKIGPYEIVQVLEGGMGLIYFARDPLDRAMDSLAPALVVLKTLKTEFLNVPGLVKRFEREARTWIRLMDFAPEGVNVVKPYRIEKYNNQLYIVMEYVGANLRGWTRHVVRQLGFFPVQECAALLTHVCDGLDYLNRQLPGFVHRDLKPENILVMSDPRYELFVRRWAKVSDLGISTISLHSQLDRDAAQPSALGAHGGTDVRVLGTRYYMSPEQRTGDTTITPASDIYSLGIMLFEMLCFAKHFGDSHWRREMTRLAKDLPTDRRLTPRAINSEVPEQLDRIVMKCLEECPRDRYQSFFILGKDLRATSDEPVYLQFRSRTSPNGVLHDKAISLASLGDYAGARELLDRLTSSDANIPEYWANKALALFYEGRSDEALECVARALLIEPNHAYALTYRGMFLRDVDPAEALRCFDQALMSAPGFVQALVQKGGTLSNLGRLDEALETLEKAIEIEPTHAGALQFKGITLSAMGRHGEAVEALERANDLEPNNPTTWYELGRCHFELRELDLAEQHYMRSAEIAPAPDAFYSAALCAFTRRDFEAAIARLDRTLQLSPTYPRALDLREDCLSRMNR